MSRPDIVEAVCDKNLDTVRSGTKASGMITSTKQFLDLSFLSAEARAADDDEGGGAHARACVHVCGRAGVRAGAGVHANTTPLQAKPGANAALQLALTRESAFPLTA